MIFSRITREQRLVKSSGQNDQYPFGWRVFSAWDFLITERETADNKLASLTTAIRVGSFNAFCSLVAFNTFYAILFPDFIACIFL